MKPMTLKLYVTGNTQRSERAVANLRRICETELAEPYEVVIIDVIEQPEQAESARILATPTLIRQLPPPIRRILGDLTDTEKVLVGLDLTPGS